MSVYLLYSSRRQQKLWTNKIRDKNNNKKKIVRFKCVYFWGFSSQFSRKKHILKCISRKVHLKWHLFYFRTKNGKYNKRKVILILHIFYCFYMRNILKGHHKEAMKHLIIWVESRAPLNSIYIWRGDFYSPHFFFW